MGLKLDLEGCIELRNVARKKKVQVIKTGAELTDIYFERKSTALQTSLLVIMLATRSNFHFLERRLMLDIA